MSSANPQDKFWGELVDRLEAYDLSSRRTNKFEDLAAWLATVWGMGDGQVVCKYVQHPKNRWNRLREASRRSPAAILLLFEGDEHGELEARVRETAVGCPSLRLVVGSSLP